ncbi:MAG: hypothetical protein ACD_62C00488G0001 [uncultured bacterium]|nr:MAG: hypothetical protein ACD_62C00488G0001 [uncultured bacterium]
MHKVGKNHGPEASKTGVAHHKGRAEGHHQPQGSAKDGFEQEANADAVHHRQDIGKIKHSAHHGGPGAKHFFYKFWQGDGLILSDFIYQTKSKNEVGEVPKKTLSDKIVDPLIKGNLCHAKNATIPGRNQRTHKKRESQAPAHDQMIQN